MGVADRRRVDDLFPRLYAGEMGGFDRLSGAWMLVGRAAILDRFTAMLSDPMVATSATPVGLALVGPAGVGKTRVAAECLALAAADGWRTVRIVGSSTAASIPFGAAVPLLSAAGAAADDVATTIRHAHQALTEPGRLCISVDDVDLLDDASSTLVQQLAASAGVTIVLTARSERASSGLLTALWRDGAVARIDMDGLDRRDHDALVEAALGAPMDSAAAQWLYEVSGGNPLFIRELLMSAAEDNALLHDDSATWRFTRPVRASSRLAEVVATRIGSLDDEERTCLESVALGEPLGLDLIEAMGLGTAVSRLERRRLVSAVPADGHIDFVTVHPLYAEVVRDRLRPLRARSLRRALVEALESRPARRPGDATRIATWKLEAGVPDSAPNLIAAAREALIAGNLETATRFATAAHEADPSGATALVLAETRFRARDGAATEALLSAGHATGEQRVRVALAVLRAKNLFWLLGRDDDAAAVLDDAAHDAADAAHDAAHDAADAADAADAESLCRVVADAQCEMSAFSEDDREREPVGAGPVRVRALTLIAHGRFDDALACVRTSPGEDVSRMALEAFVLVEGGWLANGRALAERAVQRSQGSRTAGEGWAHFAIGTVLIADGDGAAALESFRHAGHLFDRHSDPLPLSLCTSRAVFSLLLLGDVDEARRFLSRVPPHARQRIFADQLDRADAAVAVASGDVAAAAAQLRRRVDVACRRGLAGIEQTCLHDLVRLDVANSHERERVVALAEQLATPLAALRGRHAACGPDGIKLADTANEAEREGFAVWACELASAAVVKLSAAGNVRASAAEQRRVTRLRAEFPRAALMAPTGSVPQKGIDLRPGERQVAVLAAEGMSDREIAERLVLSVRTVGNYLLRVYRRLGISGRDELAAAMVDTGQGRVS